MFTKVFARVTKVTRVVNPVSMQSMLTVSEAKARRDSVDSPTRPYGWPTVAIYHRGLSTKFLCSCLEVSHNGRSGITVSEAKARSDSVDSST